jgi:hypothetical protein
MKNSEPQRLNSLTQRIHTILNIRLPDNGEVSVAAYWQVILFAFGAQLAGPFVVLVRATLTPGGGSLNVV